MIDWIGRIAVPALILYLGLLKLRQYDRELSKLVEGYLMALSVVALWGTSWLLSISNTDGRRKPRGALLLAYGASACCLVVVAGGLYEVLQVARGSPVGLVRQFVLGVLVLMFYAAEGGRE